MQIPQVNIKHSEDRAYFGPQNKSKQIDRTEVILSLFSDHNGIN